MTKQKENLHIDALWKKFEIEGADSVLGDVGDLPEDAPVVARTLRGLALYEAGRFGEATDGFKSVLGEEPQNPVAQLFLSLALFQAGHDKEAGDQLLNRTILFPHKRFLSRFIEVLWPLRFTTSLRDWERMGAEEFPDPKESEFRKLVDAPGADEKAGKQLAEFYVKQGIKKYMAEKRAEARFLFSRAQAVAPGDESAASHYAYLQLLYGRGQEAVDLLEPVLEASVRKYRETRSEYELPLPDTVVCYAWGLHENGRNRDALRVLGLLRPEGPEDYGSHFVAAVARLGLGEIEEYRAALDVALGEYFIDTWEQLVRPFVIRTGKWMLEGGRSWKPQTNSA